MSDAEREAKEMRDARRKAEDRYNMWLTHKQLAYGVACDVLALEARVAALEGNRPATPDSSPAGEPPPTTRAAYKEWYAEQMHKAGYTRSVAEPWKWHAPWPPTSAELPKLPAYCPPPNDTVSSQLEEARAENKRLRQRLAAPIDVEAFRGEFERWRRSNAATRSSLGTLAADVTFAWLAARLNAATRKEVGGE